MRVVCLLGVDLAVGAALLLGVNRNQLGFESASVPRPYGVNESPAADLAGGVTCNVMVLELARTTP